MRKLNQAIDRFCALHPRMAIPGLMRYIVGANAVIYVLSLFAGGGTLNFLCLDAASVLHGEIWRVFTYVLIPTSDSIWLIISLVFYYWLGESLERLWGSAKFTFYYASGTLLTALAAILAYLIDGISLPIYGATYVNTALFLAYALTYPDAMVRIYFIIPIRMKWLALLEAVLYAAAVFRYAMAGLWGMALIPVMALLNLMIFFSPDFIGRPVRSRPARAPRQFSSAVRLRPNRSRRAISTSAVSAAKQMLTTRTCSSVTAPSAPAITAIARSTYSTTSTSPSEMRLTVQGTTVQSRAWTASLPSLPHLRAIANRGLPAIADNGGIQQLWIVQQFLLGGIRGNIGHV